MPTLYLIDGYAQFFRAYHAIRTPMTSPVTKEPTNMSFGFLGMLLKLLRGHGAVGGPPDYVALVLDVSGDRGTFRSRLYPDYKAHRPPPPDDLMPQVQRCIAAVQELGIPVLGSEGYEADDVIATLVTRLRATHPDLRVRIISKDKDLKQLLSSGSAGASPAPVELFDIHTDEVFDEAKLKAETGLSPAQVVDMLTLMGDSADNIPGVEGVGPKTAAELIATHGSLDAVLTAAATMKGKRGENLRAAAPRLPLSKHLVQLAHDAPVDFTLADADAKKFTLPALLPVLKELGFNRYQDDLKALLEPAAPVTGPLSPAPAVPAQPKRPRAASADAGPGLFDAVHQTAAAQRAPVHTNANYRCITTREQLAEVVEQMHAAPCFALDTETTGLDPLRSHLCGVSLSCAEGTGVYIPVRSPVPDQHLDPSTVIEALAPLLTAPGTRVCGHNLKFDLLVLRHAGLEIAGLLPLPEGGAGVGSGLDFLSLDHLPPASAFDSMIASYLIDSSRSSHSLDALALALLAHTNISIKDLIGTGKDQRTFDTVPLDLATPYAAEDADIALRLRNVMLPQLRALGLMDLFARVEMPIVRVLADLQHTGILVDPHELERQRARLQGQIDALHARIDEESRRALGRTFNPDSPKQLSLALFNAPDAPPGDEGLGLKPIKRTTTGYSTDVEVLEKLADDPAITTEIPRLVLEYREVTKLVGTYLSALKDDIHPTTGRIHASFNQTVAATGRLSSSDPNLQNIPIRTELGREIRRAFIAPPGRALVSADYSQIELRLLAHLSRDPALIEAFNTDQDIHAAVAAQINKVPIDQVTKAQRNGAKMVNFGIVYGITPFGLARRLGVSNTQADEIITAYKKKFAGITTFLAECVEQARRSGYVETMLKRRRPILDIDSNQPARRALAERMAINSVVQGSAADLIKLAMIDLQGRIDAREGALVDVRMLLQIHDELVFEAPAGEPARAAQRLITERMTHAMKLSVPLKVDSSIAGNWFEGK